MKIKTVGSVCSGIEAASVAWEPLGFRFKWFSEIAPFPAAVLKEKYPSIPNVGDMNDIPDAIIAGKVDAPDMICGGTPCQAFSLAGWKNGLNDDRGNLTLRFVDIIDANDRIRVSEGKTKSVVFWENVEGVLTDKTNAFGCFVSSLAGLDEVIKITRWPTAGILHGPLRNIAWRVLDAKYFGLPQQRKRLYLLAGGKDFYPEDFLFEQHTHPFEEYPSTPLTFEKNGHQFEVFREYTDCLYAAYGTKWNGNAAANNGSLFVVQDNRIRRLSPLECERLMGFPDNYTELDGAKRTNRYQGVGNSWAVPVVRWIGERLLQVPAFRCDFLHNKANVFCRTLELGADCYYIDLGSKDAIDISPNLSINTICIPEECHFGTMSDIVDPDAPESIYISPTGCYGIVRRKNERNSKINVRLEEVLLMISSTLSMHEIEKRSRVQKRGRYSDVATQGNEKYATSSSMTQLSLFT